MFSTYWLIFFFAGIGLLLSSTESDSAELNELQRALGHESVELVYSGPYNGNPASMFGHLFIKFTNKNNLLSYTVAFMANTDDDPDVITIFKGLTGGYTASFSINPYYINTALYNNSESRDLWEFPLKLNSKEIAQLQKQIWEIQNRKPEPYLFFTRNCAYKVLELFDKLKPELELKKQSDLLIIPLDIVKIFYRNGLIDENQIQLRKSIRKHLDENLHQFSVEQSLTYRLAKTDPYHIDKLRDNLVLDTLIDRWKYQNYKKKLSLKKSDLLAFEKTLLRRAQWKEYSNSPDEQGSAHIKAKLEKPPHLSHRTSWFKFGMGNSRSSNLSSESNLELAFRLGVHSLTSSSLGLDGHSYLEYLGLDFDQHLKLTPFSIYNLDEFFIEEPLWSWKLTSQLKNTISRWNHFFDDNLIFNFEVGLGISNRRYFFLLGPTLLKNKVSAGQDWALSPQIDCGYRYENDNFVFLGQVKQSFKFDYDLLASVTYKISAQKEWHSRIQFNADSTSLSMGLQNYF
jgi:hypothetical protein